MSLKIFINIICIQTLKFMFYGFLQCADSFLYICSLLPLRILTVLIQAFHNPFNVVAK